MKIHFQSNLLLLLCFCVITNYAAAREVGWSIFDTRTDDWKLLEGSGSLEVGEHSTLIHVNAEKGARWKSVFEPVWIYRFQELHIRYRAQHLRTGKDHPFLTFDAGIIPSMPDTSKPISEWNDTDRLVVDSSLMIMDGEIHEMVIPVYERIRLDQIDEIEIELKSNGIDAILELLSFEFVNPNQQTKIVLEEFSEWTNNQLTLLQPVLIQAELSHSSVIPLPSELPDQIEVRGVPFELPDNRVIPQTAFYKRGSITVPVQRKCSELYLLLGCDLAGSDYSFRMIERDGIREPERIVIEKMYNDGSVVRSFPYHIGNQDYVVDVNMSAYVVPVNAEKILKEIRIMEWMSYGSVSLAGVTINPLNDPAITIKKETLPWIQAKENWEPDDVVPSLTVEENTRFILENSHYRVELTSEDGLWITHLSHQKIKRNMLREPSPLMAFMTKTLPIQNDDLQVVRYKAEEKRIEFELSGGVVFPVQLNISLNMDDSDMLLMRLTGTSNSVASTTFQFRFPVVENILVSDVVEDDFYFFPRKRTAWGNEDVRLQGDYSGEFPLQWMDLYSQTDQAGIAVHTQDEQLNLKHYLLMKDKHASRMAVEYGRFHPVELQSGESFFSATSAIQIHDGDWHEVLERYQEWAERVPSTSGREYKQLEEVFIVRRDYPIDGTGLLFDPTENEYSFQRFIDDSTEYFGGVDLLDISGWQYTQNQGRVGAYEEWEIGSVENLRENTSIASIENVITGIYVSGYLMDERSGVNELQLREWQITDREGLPKKRGEYELYMNPFHPDWQKFLSETAMRIVDHSGAQALYLDQLGFADHGKVDYSNRYGFPFAHPLLGEHVLLVQMRKVLDWLENPVGLYAEQVPVDLTSRMLDGACSFGMTGDREYPSPARMNAFRYAYPGFRVLEKIQPGVFPKAVDASLVKLSFFHGHGLWLKGKAKSWYSQECREVIQKVQRIYSSYSDLFSSNVIPMVPTKQTGLFANHFSGDGKKLITVYNATMNTVQGELIACDNETGHVINEWGTSGFSFQHDGDVVVIHGILHPHEVGCFLVE